jgi:hypothetical protein
MPASKFDESVRRPIALNQARTPDQRFRALCDLLDAARAMAPTDEAARERRRRALAARQREREQWRAELRRFCASRGSKSGDNFTAEIAENAETQL